MEKRKQIMTKNREDVEKSYLTGRDDKGDIPISSFMIFKYQSRCVAEVKVLKSDLLNS